MQMSLLSHGVRWSIAFLMESRRLKGPEHGFTHMKLQKLLYYMQGYHVAALGQPLFVEPIEAWEHGPVVRDVWHQFKRYGADDIPPSITGELQLAVSAISTDYQLTLLNRVYDIYGRFTAGQLRDRTHSEPPWLKTYEPNVGNVIPLTRLQRYFRKFV
jgi:uncharacterized phage-associated protein